MQWEEQARATTSTHTRTVSLVIHRMDGASARIGHKIDTRRRAPLIKLMGIEHREDTVGGGEREHAVANTHTHTQCYS